MKRYAYAAIVIALGGGILGGCTADRDFSNDYNPHAGQLFAPSPAPAKMAEAPKAAAKSEQPKPAAKAAEQPKAAPMSGDGMVRTAMGFPTGERNTSAVWLERTAPAEVIAGQDFQYFYKVTNLTNMSLKEVQLKDMCASGFTVTSSNPQSSSAAPNLAWNLGDFGPGESKTVTVNGKATGVGTLTSCATVSYNSLLCINTNVVKPALAITKTGPAEVTLCEAWPYEITVTNSGTGAARDVKVTDSLPAGLKTTDGKTALDYAVGTLNSGESKKMTVMVKADKTGSYTNSASAAAANGLTAESGKVTTVVKAPVLAIKAECGGNILIGRETTFKFTVTNTGDAACKDTMVTSTVPAGTSFSKAEAGGTNAGGKVTWNVGALAPKESKSVSYTVRSTGAGSIQVSATATCTCANAATDSCSTNVQGVPDIGTGITDDNGVVLMGDKHVFTYVVKNQGQIDLTNVKVVATLDDGLNFASSSFQGAVASGKTVTFGVGTLKVGQQVRFDITCTGSKEGELVIQTVTTSDQTKPVRNDEQVNYIAK